MNPGAMFSGRGSVRVRWPLALAITLVTLASVASRAHGQSCKSDDECDDLDPCTTDTCPDGTCVFTPVPGCCNTAADCNDSDPCTADSCVSNACVHTPIAGCCLSAADCDDGDPCTIDACAGNLCTHTAPDSDGDGVPDCRDQCPNTPAGETVDSNGCSCSQLDDDQDGVNNCNDLCPGTPAGETVDANGCPPAAAPQPICDPTQNYYISLLLSLGYCAPGCGVGCPIVIISTICGLMSLRAGLRRRRRPGNRRR